MLYICEKSMILGYYYARLASFNRNRSTPVSLTKTKCVVYLCVTYCTFATQKNCHFSLWSNCVCCDSGRRCIKIFNYRMCRF